MAQQPIHKERIGLINASVWRNSGSNGDFYSITVNRSYKDGDDWKQSNSFGRDDLLNVAKVLDLAHTWIHQQN